MEDAEEGAGRMNNFDTNFSVTCHDFRRKKEEKGE